MPRQSTKQREYNAYKNSYRMKKELTRKQIALWKEFAKNPALDDIGKEDSNVFFCK